jgi:hypothetical protein
MKKWRPTKLTEPFYKIVCYVETGRYGFELTESIFTNVGIRYSKDRKEAEQVARKIKAMLKGK